ncbi:MAG: vitamin K epoxide reductase [Bacteroidetes bacterium QH_7_62_13]|nr:MAG: vitamin K epoxide reductase [Bacteroidetes bacterium QH_7_62_13]
MRIQFPKRLQGSHPTLEKTVFGLSLLGVLTVAHLYIQHSRNFDRGCVGFSGLDTGQMAFDCSMVVSSGAGTLLGLSNTTWGLGFYICVAALTFAIFLSRGVGRALAHALRIGALVGGVGYSGYLVYFQVNAIEALCALCLLSATIVLLLFGAQLAALRANDAMSETTMNSRLFKRDLTIYVYLAAFTAVLVGADLAYFNTVPTTADETANPDRGPVSEAACKLDSTTEPVANNGASLINFQDVTKGPSDASVTIIEYFDPNCPHCKTFHQTMKPLVSEYGEQVQVVYKPFPLGRGSLPEIQALYLANEEDKFSKMLEAQYSRQNRSGISKQDLRAIASEIGMNSDVLVSKIDQGKYRKKIVAQYKRAREIGVDSTPTVLVNGHFVQSRSQECMETFIQRAQEGKLGGGAASE